MKRLGISVVALAASSAASAQGGGDPTMIFRAWKALDLPAEQRDYLEANAPYGFDITHEGRLWVNLNEAGQQDDYGMLVDDILKANEYGATVWIRGYHKRNPKVKYRTSMTRYTFNCKNPSIYTLNRVTYAADGSVIDSEQYPYYSQSARTIIPGSVGEGWWMFACRKP